MGIRGHRCCRPPFASLSACLPQHNHQRDAEQPNRSGMRPPRPSYGHHPCRALPSVHPANNTLLSLAASPADDVLPSPIDFHDGVPRVGRHRPTSLPPVWRLSRGANSPNERHSIPRTHSHGYEADEPYRLALMTKDTVALVAATFNHTYCNNGVCFTVVGEGRVPFHLATRPSGRSTRISQISSA